MLQHQNFTSPPRLWRIFCCCLEENCTLTLGVLKNVRILKRKNDNGGNKHKVQRAASKEKANSRFQRRPFCVLQRRRTCLAPNQVFTFIKCTVESLKLKLIGAISILIIDLFRFSNITEKIYLAFIYITIV